MLDPIYIGYDAHDHQDMKHSWSIRFPYLIMRKGQFQYIQITDLISYRNTRVCKATTR